MKKLVILKGKNGIKMLLTFTHIKENENGMVPE